MAPLTDRAENDYFLPNFCGLRAVLSVVVLVELFAFVLTLASAPHRNDLMGVLALYSLFMQWAGLISAAVLCAARGPLLRLDDTLAGIISYFLLLLLLGLLSIIAHFTMELTGFPNAIASRGEFLLRNLGIGAIVCAITLRYFYVTHQWQRRTRAEATARLEALQARIRPHFLFNSINTISSLIHDKPDDAEEALLDLADLFRASLREGRQFIPLAEELALTRRYLNMESLRLGERLQQEWQLAEGSEELLLPPLILQPLVENAVYHGIEPLPGGGTITIAVERDQTQLRIAVTNPLPQQSDESSEGNRIALQNIRDRLEAHYGDRASLHISDSGESYQVRLTLPCGEAR